MKKVIIKVLVTVFCMQLALGGLVAVLPDNITEAEITAQARSSIKKSNTMAGLKRFKSYKSLKKYIKKVKKQELQKRKQMISKFRERTVFSTKNAGNVSLSVAYDSSNGTDHTGTYTQVKGVDEADRVKTDGRYIYMVSSDNSSVSIFRAAKGKVKRVAKISAGKSGKNVYRDIEEIYIKGNKLAVVGSYYNSRCETLKNKRKRCGSSFAAVTVYNIKNRKHPVKTGYYYQNGVLVSSRMIGSCIYLISNEYVYDMRSPMIPCIKKKGKTSRIKAKNIYAFTSAKSTNYTVAGSVDISSGKKMKTRTRAVLGSSNDIYCNLTSLYIASSPLGYYFDSAGWDDAGDFGFSGSTTILRASLTNGTIKFTSSGKVKGLINNQFSMDEDGGYFRVATTAGTDDGEDINRLYVMNKSMKVVGQTEGFAKGEHIEAVRFLGKKAYVITYEVTDPLFAVDLSSPEHPVLKGSAGVTGFSTLLHPAGNNKLIGIGYSTEPGDDETDMEIQNGLKIVLFDVSEMTAPKVMDEKSFIDLYSDVQYDHRGFLVNKKKKYYAVPYYDYDGKGGVICFAVSGEKIVIKKNWKWHHEAARCVAIGKYVYVVSEYDDISSFRM